MVSRCRVPVTLALLLCSALAPLRPGHAAAGACPSWLPPSSCLTMELPAHGADLRATRQKQPTLRESCPPGSRQRACLTAVAPQAPQPRPLLVSRLFDFLAWQLAQQKVEQWDGCGKSDQVVLFTADGPATDLKSQVTDTQLATRGLALPSQQHDECEDEQVREYFCVKDTTTGQVYLKSALFLCPAGSACQKGRCQPQPGLFNGCLPGQAPFIDVNGTGEDDSCVCPTGTVPIDDDGDFDSDTCHTKGAVCSSAQLQKKVKDASLSDLYGEDGSLLQVINYCAEAEATAVCAKHYTHQLICDANQIVSTTQTPCPPGTECQNGLCLSTGGGWCDGSQMQLDPYTLGCVVLYDAQGGAKYDCDSCDAIDLTKVWNKQCSDGCGETSAPVESYCAAGDLCENGRCVESLPSQDPPDDGIDCIKTPQLPACQGVDCMKTPNDPKCTSPENPPDGPPDDPPCTPDTKPICENDSDPGQDPHLFGSIENGVEISGCLLPQPIKKVVTKNDVCVPSVGADGATVAILYQFGCANGALTQQATICEALSPTDGEDCDALAATAQLQGVCAPYQTPQCSDTSPDAGKLDEVGTVSGTDGFGHPIGPAGAGEKDKCIPMQGFGAVLKWSCFPPGTTEKGGLGYYAEKKVCAPGHECVGGACTPIQTPDPVTCATQPLSPACVDTDGDGVMDLFDNCVSTANADQADSDKDGIGDVCDNNADLDQDGIDDAVDNCVQLFNPQQEDGDGDGIGDVCDNAALDCGKTPAHPLCQGPAGPPHVCADNDTSNNIQFRGDVYLDKGTPAEAHQSDFCIGEDTAVMEVNCGPGGKFVIKAFGCSGGTCQEGKCVFAP